MTSNQQRPRPPRSKLSTTTSFRLEQTTNSSVACFGILSRWLCWLVKTLVVTLIFHVFLALPCETVSYYGHEWMSYWTQAISVLLVWGQWSPTPLRQNKTRMWTSFSICSVSGSWLCWMLWPSRVYHSHFILCQVNMFLLTHNNNELPPLMQAIKFTISDGCVIVSGARMDWRRPVLSGLEMSLFRLLNVWSTSVS